MYDPHWDLPILSTTSQNGGGDWSNNSYSHRTNMVYFPYGTNPVAHWRGASSNGQRAMGQYQTGGILGYDASTGEVQWKNHLGTDMSHGQGPMTTASDLLFVGQADGHFLALDATNGDELWRFQTGSSIAGAPITYEIDGEQYVSIAVGWGGVYGIVQRATDRVTPGRVYTFKVGGSTPMPPTVQAEKRPLVQGIAYSKADVEHATGLYVANCGACHGVPGVNSGGNVPNLGYSARETLENLPHLVLNGAFLGNGMPSFAGRLDEGQVLQVRAFILDQVDTVRRGPPPADADRRRA